MSTRTILALALILAFAGSASAHITHSAGKYALKVGWDQEPSETMVYNHVTLSVWDNATGEGISGLTGTLNVTVTLGGQSKQLDVEESDEAPGNYSAPIEPTQAGLVVVHVSGKINNVPVDLNFNIEEIHDVKDVQFPETQDTAADIAQLKADVAALKAKAQTSSSTPATVIATSPSSGGVSIPSIGFAAALGAIAGAALVAVATRRRQ